MYKFSNKNDSVCGAERNIQKILVAYLLVLISTYNKWNFKPQILSIFHFDRVSDSRMAQVLGVNRLK